MAIYTWLSSSLERNYPATPVKRQTSLAIDTALNERFSFHTSSLYKKVLTEHMRTDIFLTQPRKRRDLCPSR